MKFKHCLMATVLIASFLTACDDDDDDVTPNNTLSATDSSFMRLAAFGNKAEIDAGTLASTKGTNPAVKTFGQMMVMDHQTAYDDLSSLASSWSITIPTTPDPVHVAKKEYLMTLTGHSFDTAYINAQVMDHENTVALFQKQLDSGRNQQLKDYANKYLPKIKMHLMMADSLDTVFEQ
jgi:putative membrane protein